MENLKNSEKNKNSKNKEKNLNVCHTTLKISSVTYTEKSDNKSVIFSSHEEKTAKNSKLSTTTQTTYLQTSTTCEENYKSKSFKIIMLLRRLGKYLK